MKINFREFGYILLGRLTGYLAIGAAFGYLGQVLKINQLTYFSLISLGLLSFVIILYSLNFFQWRLPSFCATFKKVKPPFFIGLLTGLNICPPFLLSLNYILVMGSVAKGLIFFFFFFLVTSLYFIPLIFLGKLSRLNDFKILARWTLLIVSTIFLIYSIYGLLNLLKL